MVRVKRRYIVARLVGKRNQGSFMNHEILEEISNQVAQSYGDFGVGCLKRAFNIKRHDSFSGYIIIQVRKGVHELVMSVIPMIAKVGDKPCQVNIVHLSGTIRSSLKHLKQSYIMHLRASIADKMAIDARKRTNDPQVMH